MAMDRRTRRFGLIKEFMAEHNVKLKQVAISISGHAVIVKKISLPPMPDEEPDGPGEASQSSIFRSTSMR